MPDIKQISFSLDGEQRKCSIVREDDSVETSNITQEQYDTAQAALGDFVDSLEKEPSEDDLSEGEGRE